MKKAISILIALLLVTLIPLTATTQEITHNFDLPEYFTWQDIKGTDYTTSIKNQAPCPSCETYALVAALETLVQYKVGYPFNCDLSEMHLFFAPGGTCRWGVNVADAADYLVEYGVPDEGCFPDPRRPYDSPLEPVSGWEERTVKIKSWGWVENDEQEIKNALIDHGPLVICIWVWKDFQYYRGGIYKHRWGEIVGGHLVTLVGYNDRGQYWIVKNSWGKGWGDDGWIRMAYDPSIFIPNCYGGTGILYVDGVYGNLIPEVPRIHIIRPRRGRLYYNDVEFPIRFKKLPLVPNGVARLIGWTTVETNTTNAEKVEFHLDGKLHYTDYEPPFKWTFHEYPGVHTIETYAYDDDGDPSKDICDVFVFR